VLAAVVVSAVALAWDSRIIAVGSHPKRWYGRVCSAAKPETVFDRMLQRGGSVVK
jgi:hypothetical protein